MNTLIEKIIDPCSNKHQGNEQSRAANRRNMQDREQQRSQVLNLIIEHNGLSMKEVAQMMGVPFNTVSGRGTELKKFGLVEPTGEIRSGSAVLCATTRGLAPIKVTKPEEPKPEAHPIKPMSPSQVQKELEKLEALYEKGEKGMTDEMYDTGKKYIYKCLEAWMNA
jgi:transposase